MPIHAFLYDADGADQAIELNDNSVGRLSDRQLLWIDVTGNDPHEIETVGSVIHLHRESVKNLLNPIGRPRLDQFGSYFQINVVAIESDPQEGPGQFRNIPLDFFAGPNYVVTVHAKELQVPARFR